MSKATRRCQSEIRANKGETLTAESVQRWIDQVPHDAELAAIQEDRGNQRDPWLVLVGLRATWGDDQ